MTRRFWTKEEKLFLKENYPTKGIDFCANALQVEKNKVIKMANHIGLTLNKYDYIKDFMSNPEKLAYFLGFFNGDGYLKLNGYSINIEIVSDDALEVENFINFTKWKKYYRQRENWKEVTKFHISSKDLVTWFCSLGFHEKSIRLPDISLIPNEYLHLFILGLFDADGCITQKMGKYGTFQISSNYNYDWSGIQNILKDVIKTPIKILHTVHKSKNHKSSTINLYSNENLRDIYEYMYQSYDKNHLGLTRKKNKFELILSKFPATLV